MARGTAGAARHTHVDQGPRRLAGHPTRKGSLALRDAPPATSNGVVPERLRRAGAIVVGKSTLPEFAIEGYTANELTGVTRNPWNEAYSPGGSSGGSAAALAAGLVGVATATDGGGSIRIPASLCGLVGIKPTNGMVGRWPAPDWIDYSTDGPFATASDDLRLLYDVMIGPTPGDPSSPHSRWRARWSASRAVASGSSRPSEPRPGSPTGLGGAGPARRRRGLRPPHGRGRRMARPRGLLSRR